MNFEGRTTKQAHLKRIAEIIQKQKFGDFKSYFKKTIIASENNFLFKDIWKVRSPCLINIFNIFQLFSLHF